jgi:serine protease
MPHQRWSRVALALAPILALMACDQVGSLWERIRGETSDIAGPASMDGVPLDARAISGSVQPQDQISALLAPEPVLIAPGEILIGARVEAELSEAAADLGLASAFVRALRTQGSDAMDTSDEMPQQTLDQVRARAETEAGDAARDSARIVLERLGIQGELELGAGGVVKLNLAPDGASPTALHAAQLGATPVADALLQAVEWSPSDRCPRIVTQGALEEDLSLATLCAIQRLQASRQFEFVEPNYIATTEFDWLPRREPPRPTTPPPGQPAPTTPSPTPIVGGIPNDPLLALQWHYRARGTGEGLSPGGAGFTAFWQANQVGSRQVRVAVIDTGIDLTHPDIRASNNVASGIDLISNAERGGDGDGIDTDAQDAGDRCGTATEDSFHGTHVAGTIGATATNDRVGVAGGAWQVTIVPVRALGRCGGELADISSGIRWAAGVAPAIGEGGVQIANRNPADIINLSLSIQAPCPASMQAAIDAATQRGAVIVVAAGNKANQTRLYAPSNCNNVIVVAANDERGDLAFYSNFGPEVDIVAPGGDVFADADGDGRPDGVLSTRTTRSGCYDPLNQNSTEQCYYSFLQGTSMAAPHVSSALALLAAQTGLRGRSLENVLFARAVGPEPATFGQIECTRSRNATPISAGSATCARPTGRGYLDLARAAQTIAGAAPP